MLEIRLYRDDAGREPFQDWLRRLDRHARGKIAIAIRRIAEGNLGDVKAIGEGVWERRIHWGPGYRIYFGRRGQMLVILLGGGTKQTQTRDIGVALRRWRNASGNS